MYRTSSRVVVVVAAAACGLALSLTLSSALTGCGPKKNPTRTNTTGPIAAGESNPQSPAMSDADTRITELRERSRELSATTAQLPGRGAADDRKRVADAFDKTASSLQLLGGPEPGGAFRQQLRIVDNTRAFLNAPPSGVTPDPSIDTGLRSIESALGSVRERLFPNDDKVKGELDLLRTRLSELDSVRGPIHSLVVAQTFQAASNVIDTMATELDARNEAVRQAQQPRPAAPAPARPQPSAQAAPSAMPAASTTPPPVTRAMQPAPAVPAPVAAPAAPSGATIPPPPAQKRSYEELQRDYEKLQQQYQELQQKMQQQQPQQPAPAR